MPFARHSSYSFTNASIRQNAPAWGGIYGLSNAQSWIYIRLIQELHPVVRDGA